MDVVRHFSLPFKVNETIDWSDIGFSFEIAELLDRKARKDRIDPSLE